MKIFNDVKKLLTDVNSLQERLEVIDIVNEHSEASIKNLNKKLSDIEASIKNLEEFNVKLETSLTPYIEKYKQRENESLPFIDIETIEVDDEHGIKFKIDFNDAMIKSLKSAGYKGTDDDDIIHKYLYDIFNSKIKEIDGYDR